MEGLLRTGIKLINIKTTKNQKVYENDEST